MKHAKPLLVITAIAAFQVSAETAFRSVDEQGKVTFSDQPVSGAAQEEQVTIDATAPSPQDQQEAQRREAELQKAAGQAGISAAPNKAHQKKAARQAVQDAENELQDTRLVREGDRIGTAGGGSRLTSDYRERVREAETKVDRARKEMEEVR